MVTSNKQPDKKVLKMTDQPSSVMVVPQRTLLGEVNEHITCPLCRGYYIDATTIVECLHSFCRSCIIKHLQVKSYCPVCEMMINSAKPNIKPDKALQDIVYKLVPGLFQREMERRQHFYASRPGPAASATPEQRGEDTERIIFSPEDVISFSLEYIDVTDTDSISSKSSDSNEPQPTTATSRRFLQCPAVVNISHLKKFISMKFDIDSTRFAIDILYKRVPLPDYYTLMDIAYIYNWKRNEPMRFFYQITDYIAIRTRYGLFDMNRNGSHFRDIKSSPTPTEETSASSPVPTLNEQLCEASSGTESPMPDEANLKKVDEVPKKLDQLNTKSSSKGSSQKKNDDEVEKSQFLNSFELKAKSNCSTLKPVTVKLHRESVKLPTDQNRSDTSVTNTVPKSNNDGMLDDTLMKRKQTISESPDVKKAKLEVEEKKSSGIIQPEQIGKHIELSQSSNKQENISKTQSLPKNMNNPVSPSTSNIKPNFKQVPDGTPIKKIGASASQSIQSSKSKHNDSHSQAKSLPTSQSVTKPSTPTKPKMANTETAQNTQVKSDNHKINKKIPDLKPSIPQISSSHKNPAIGKVRMDLLANNSDPTIDRSKILSQVKTCLGSHNSGQMAGDPLKSLFDSCKINIPSSLSITLTDQKQEQRNTNESTDNKKNVLNKNLAGGVGNMGSHKVPSPPVHNYIEILKLPDTDSSKKQQIKTELPTKSNSSPKNDSGISQTKTSTKPSETTAKGPIPSLKPISDTKLAKGSPSTAAAAVAAAAAAAAASCPTPSPITFQQTFEQQLQSEKTKLPKNKLQVPKLMPATPKAISAANKLNNLKTNAPENKASILKSDNILDLSSTNVQSNLDPQQTKKFETMQSIANLAKKQVMATKNMSSPQSASSLLPSMLNRPIQAGNAPIKLQAGSSNINQIKHDKNSNPMHAQASLRQDITNKNNVSKQPSGSVIPGTSSPTYQLASHSAPVAQPSPRSQTRSPSSSPKLVIAEEKHPVLAPEPNMNQSNQITSTQIVNTNALKNESSSSSPTPSTSKQVLKPTKNVMSTSRLPSPLQVPQNFANLRIGAPGNNPADFLSQPQLLSAQHAILRHHMEMQNAWIKAQRQYDLFKNMSNINNQNDNKDNK